MSNCRGWGRCYRSKTAIVWAAPQIPMVANFFGALWIDAVGNPNLLPSCPLPLVSLLDLAEPLGVSCEPDLSIPIIGVDDGNR